MRMVIANSALRASLAICHLISNARSWNNCLLNCTVHGYFTRWSGDVIQRTGMKNFKAISHNRARPYFRIQHRRGEVRARRVYLNVHSATGNVVDTEWSVEFRRWKCCREFGNHLKPRAVVGYGVKIFLPSPPNYVTRSPGIFNSAINQPFLYVNDLTTALLFYQD